MSPKTLLLVSFVVSSFVLATSAGCGDDDEGGAAGFSCPKAGDKVCTNDTAVTQATADSCKKCEAENKAYSACLGGPKCGADGRSEQPSNTQCPTELDALIKCIQGGTSSSGGADAGGGG